MRTFLEAALSSDAALVFAASIPDGIGMSFAGEARYQAGLANVAGVWLSVQPGDPEVTTSIFFHSPQSGPRLLFQHFYQAKGGQVWFYDVARAPGSAVAPTPDPPKP